MNLNTFENLGAEDKDKARNSNTNTEDISSSELEPVIETETSVSYLGAKLEKAKNQAGQFVPRKEQYEDYITDKFSAQLQQKIAISFEQGDPILIEGGTSIGKTTTVKKMCAELGWEVHYANLNGATDVEDLMGRYIPNPNKSKADDPEYIFADGKVTQGLRQEEDKIKVIILDELNSAAPNILIRLHEVLDSLERGSDVVLSEDASESVQVHKNKTKVISLMNPPGKGYFGREPLDPAQLRRWVYQKEVTDLPDDTFSMSTDALFSLAPNSEKITKDLFLNTPEYSLAPEQLAEIEGLQEITAKYKEFHKAAKEMLKVRQLAEDQPQPFSYDDRMEPKRVRDFILRFYNGDINETFQKALIYYYVNKLESDEDKKKIKELIRMVSFTPKKTESKRKGLDQQAETQERQDLINEINKLKGDVSDLLPEKTSEKTEILKESKLEGSIKEQIDKAQEIMGEKEVMGPSEIKKAFGIEIKESEVPPIPFNEAELERAKELGQFLVLRVNEAQDKESLTMEKINQLLEKDLKDKDKGKILYSVNWYAKESFYTNETPNIGWALTSKEVIPESTSKNYLEQTEEIAQYLEAEVFNSTEMPTEYKEAIKELKDKKEELAKLIKTGDKSKYEPELSKLKLNKLTRQSPVEALYDILIYFQNNNERLLENKYTWTHITDSDGKRVRLGYFDSDGTGVNGNSDDDSYSTLGVLLSRNS